MKLKQNSTNNIKVILYGKTKNLNKAVKIKKIYKKHEKS